MRFAKHTAAITKRMKRIKGYVSRLELRGYDIGMIISTALGTKQAIDYNRN
jgi:hypothetical protein